MMEQVVEYPPDLVAKLYAANPGGVSAPLVLIEKTDTVAYHHSVRCRRDICCVDRNFCDQVDSRPL